MTIRSCLSTQPGELATWSSRHAVDALAIFYPRVSRGDVLFQVALGVEIERRTVDGLLQRRGSQRPDSSRYVLHRERTGIFVIDGCSVITFLRFYGLEQYQLATRLWPGGDPPTCRSSWIAAVVPARRPGRSLPSISKTARDATGLDNDTIRQRVAAAIDQGFTVPGELEMGGAMVAVVRVDDRLRVVACRRYATL